MPRLFRLFALLMLGLVPASLFAEPWSEKLGYPPGRRVVILDARELGISWEMNVAAQELMEAGHLTSASAVATGPWFPEIVEWCRRHPQHDVGLSIALTNPYATIRWRLFTSEQRPTTLVNAEGFPWQNVVQLAASADPEDVRRELDAQILMARAAGFAPSHLSGYHGTAFSRADLAEVFLGAAQKYWIPAPVVELTPELIERFRAQGFPVDERMIRLINSYTLPKLDDLQHFPVAETYEQTRDNFCQLLTLIPPGLTQILCRPAVESEGLKRLTPDWQQRSWTRQALQDEKVLETIKSQQILSTTWRDVMHRFEQGTPLKLEELREQEKLEHSK